MENYSLKRIAGIVQAKKTTTYNTHFGGVCCVLFMPITSAQRLDLLMFTPSLVIGFIRGQVCWLVLFRCPLRFGNVPKFANHVYTMCAGMHMEFELFDLCCTCKPGRSVLCLLATHPLSLSMFLSLIVKVFKPIFPKL